MGGYKTDLEIKQFTYQIQAAQAEGRIVANKLKTSPTRYTDWTWVA